MMLKPNSKRSLILGIAVAAFVIIPGASAFACQPCKKLSELSKRSAQVKEDEVTKVIAETGPVFQDVVRAQTKLDATSAHDMIAIIVNVMEEDPALTAAENLYIFYKQKRFKPVFDEQLKKFRQNEIDSFKKAMKEIEDSDKVKGNG